MIARNLRCETTVALPALAILSFGHTTPANKTATCKNQQGD
jgi:hypothetical protein